MASRRRSIDLTGLINLTGWAEKKSGLIKPDERLPWVQTFAMGVQHVLAMFGATVVAPLIMGFDPNVAIFFSGIGTLIFFVMTGGRIPSYLGSSFAFIAPVAAVTGSATVGDFNAADIPKALGGIIIAGLLYTIIGAIVDYTGSGWIDALMPPLVTGAVVAIIGLNLAGAARDLAERSMSLAFITIIAIFVIALFTKGILGRLPILLGAIAGYLAALILGGTTVDGRDVGPFSVSGVDLDPVRDAAWIGLPDFVTPSFDWNAISLIAPVAVVLVAENTGHIKAVSVMTRRDLMPWLGRGFMGDGVATMVAGTGGGTGVTTYAENIGVMAVTKVFSTLIFVVAAGIAILLGLSPKFGALINSIPAGVLGGVSTVLFGLIAITGARIWVENRVDFSRGVNLFVAAVTIIIGAANYTITVGDFALEGIALGTFGAIILYQIFRIADPDAERPIPVSGAYPASSAGREPSEPYPVERRRRQPVQDDRPPRRRQSPGTTRESGNLPDLPQRQRREGSGDPTQRNRRERYDEPPSRQRRRRPPRDV